MNINVPSIWQHSWPYSPIVERNPCDLKTKVSQIPWIPYGNECTLSADDLESGNYGVHCYTEDFRFEKLWSDAMDQLFRVIFSEFVIAPDFSIHYTAPYEIVRWQLYRSNQIAGYLSSQGVRVIPSLNWNTKRNIYKCIDLYPKCNIYAVRSPNSKYYDRWMAGAELLNKLLKPDLVLHFGTKLGINIWPNAVQLPLRKKKSKNFKNFEQQTGHN